MMIFSYQFAANEPKITVELSSESTLPEVVEQFESFLKGVGYEFKGHLDFVSDEADIDA